MKGQFKIASRSGQATLEYMLVLVVVFALYGILHQFNTGFRSFVQNYYEAYLSCLLETGELPTLGLENAQSECDDDYKAFTFTAGRPPKDVPFVNNGVPGGEKTETAKSEPKGANPPPPVEAGTSGGRASDGGAGVIAGVGDGPQLLQAESGRPRTVPLTGSDMASGSRAAGFVLGSQDSTATKSGGTQSDDYVPGANGALDDGSSLRKGTVPAPQEEQASSSRRVPADVQKLEQAVADPGWTLPDFIKWMIIIGIIIAMLVFFGSQALQISKSGDK